VESANERWHYPDDVNLSRPVDALSVLAGWADYRPVAGHRILERRGNVEFVVGRPAPAIASRARGRGWCRPRPADWCRRTPRHSRYRIASPSVFRPPGPSQKAGRPRPHRATLQRGVGSLAASERGVASWSSLRPGDVTHSMRLASSEAQRGLRAMSTGRRRWCTCCGPASIGMRRPPPSSWWAARR
jgi:hypothetical protein